MPEAICAIHGTNHKMFHEGVAHIRDANTREIIYSWWAWYKCACGDVFACSGDPHLGPGWSIGNYLYHGDFTEFHGAPSSAATGYTYPSRVKYSSSTTLSGYTFYQ